MQSQRLRISIVQNYGSKQCKCSSPLTQEKEAKTTSCNERMATRVQKSVPSHCWRFLPVTPRVSLPLPTSLQCFGCFACSSRRGPQDWARVDHVNLFSLEPVQSAWEVSILNQSLTFHRPFLFLILCVDHHGAQLWCQRVIVLNHSTGPIAHGAGYSDSARLITCCSDHRARIQLILLLQKDKISNWGWFDQKRVFWITMTHLGASISGFDTDSGSKPPW